MTFRWSFVRRSRAKRRGGRENGKKVGQGAARGGEGGTGFFTATRWSAMPKRKTKSAQKCRGGKRTSYKNAFLTNKTAVPLEGTPRRRQSSLDLSPLISPSLSRESVTIFCLILHGVNRAIRIRSAFMIPPRSELLLKRTIENLVKRS